MSERIHLTLDSRHARMLHLSLKLAVDAGELSEGTACEIMGVDRLTFRSYPIDLPWPCEHGSREEHQCSDADGEWLCPGVPRNPPWPEPSKTNYARLQMVSAATEAIAHNCPHIEPELQAQAKADPEQGGLMCFSCAQLREAGRMLRQLLAVKEGDETTSREDVAKAIAAAMGYEYVFDQPKPGNALWPDKSDFLDAADAVLASKPLSVEPENL